MGPPKVKPKPKPYSQLLKENDIFEYRWNEESQSYYLFNPYTGETIFSTDFEYMNRAQSMWAAPDRAPSTTAHTISLYSEFYKSRSWGRRPFRGYDGDTDTAATRISAGVKGFLARRRLSHYFFQRYYTLVCPFSGYYYFHDTLNPRNDTTWFKPRLAFPTDIQPYSADDAEHYLGNDKYSYHDINTGPIVTRKGVGKKSVKRVKTEAMIKLNPWRDQAINHPSKIDLETVPLGTIISWMDDQKALRVRVDEYAILRAACNGNNWEKVG
jgi:hypothetical protein